MTSPPRIPRNTSNTFRLGDRMFIKLTHTGPNGTVAFDRDDLVIENKQRLAGYASSLTSEAGNDPPISTGYAEFHTHDSQGNTSDLTDPSAGNQTSFTGNMTAAGSAGTTAVQSLNKAAHSGLLDVDGSPFGIKKGKEHSDSPDITTILNDVNENKGNSDFSNRVAQILVDNNRFNQGHTFTQGPNGESSPTEDNSNLASTPIQQKLGVHSPRKFPTVELGDPQTILKLADLKNLGLLTMLQASGEYNVPANPNDMAQQLAARGTSLVPGLARLGVKVGANRFSAAKVMSDINPKYVKPTLGDDISRPEVLSYGSVNNWLVPFAGMVDTGSIASAGILLITVGGLMKAASTGLAALAARSVTAGTNHNNPDQDKRKRRLGSYLAKEVGGDNIVQLDVVQTSHDFFACVDTGINIFFDVQNGAIATAGHVAKNHGYYNTVLRSIVRSTSDFVAQAGGLVGVNAQGGPTSVNDVTVLGNPMALFSMVEKFNSSVLLKFMNVVASIGDVALTHQDAGFSVDLAGSINQVISSIDDIVETFQPQSLGNAVGDIFNNPLNPAVLQAKSRLGDGTLAWRQGSIQSLYILPSNVINGVGIYNGASNQVGNQVVDAFNGLSRNNVIADPGHSDREANGRIKPEVVAAMEDYLEADYMPFYWHDLRTNEIISFHAFLEDVTDSYDAEYQEVEGYGRIGGIPIYKNTKRSVGLSFRVVATNSEDFDEMWWKIDKFITLVYPQYTMGRQVGTGNEKFIQPFSQLPGASPMVRLRVGDLFKSNYSALSVSRLFGIDSGQFHLEGLDTSSFTYDVELQRRFETTFAAMTAGTYSVGQQALLHANYAGPHANNRNTAYPRATYPTPVIATPPVQSARRSARTAHPATPATTGPLHLTTNKMVTIQAVFPATVGPPTYNVTVVSPAAGEDGTYYISAGDLTAVATSAMNYVAGQAQGANASSSATPTTPGTPESIRTFFKNDGSEDANPILKSFASTKGKGLAGFIKSIRFDWADARWVTDKFNGRAPMSMKLQVEFLPIHDINPGIDHNGFNTAPIYNVGDIAGAYNRDPQSTTDEQSTFKSGRNAMVRPRNSTNR